MHSSSNNSNNNNNNGSSVNSSNNPSPLLGFDEPLTRKARRISLSEIGFGKLESYEKLEQLGEGTYATVFKGRSHLTRNNVALKVREGGSKKWRE